MDDVVLREVTILIRDCAKMAQTLRMLRKGLRNDPRFSTLLNATEGCDAPEKNEQIKKAGPEDQTDPFSVPLAFDFD